MKNVAVAFGGDSSEFAVSVQSAANVYGWVDTEKYRPYMVQMQRGCWRVQREGKRGSAAFFASRLPSSGKNVFLQV